MVFSSGRSSVLSAILVASTVFSGLTLPFFFYRSQVESAQSEVELPFLHQQLQPILINQNRDLTIRYIGGAMVISVAAGLTTLELQRRWQAVARKRSLAMALPQTLALGSSERPAATRAASSNSQSNLELDNREVSANDPDTQLERGWLSELIDRSINEEQMIGPDFQPSGGATVQPGTIVEQAEELPTCHIWSTDQQRRLLAVQFEGQYYSFFRLFTTHAEAWDAAQQLSMQQHHLIITLADQMYALWVLQPEAQPASLLL
jgi:hypothetical protein